MNWIRIVTALAAINLAIGTNAIAQMKQPVKWEFQHEVVKKDEVVLTFKASLDEGWHIYSQHMEEGGPMPTSFAFDPSDDYELVGSMQEESPVIKKYSDIFLIDMIWFTEEAVFKQKIRLKSQSATVSGSVEFMACTDIECLLPETKTFSFHVKGGPKSAGKTEPTRRAPRDSAREQAKISPAKTSRVTKQTVLERPAIKVPVIEPDGFVPARDRPTVLAEQEPEAAEGRSLWSIFIAGLVGGLAAIFMPCIFPMIPLTVSYFTKRNGTGKKPVASGLIYGLSIVVIYVSLGLGVSLIFGSQALNALSTNGVFNLVFFFILVLFAISFLGVFDLTLPARWVNAVDAKADNSKGWSGIFLMAVALALVSFSCTGPIVGTLMVETATMGSLAGPTLGMFGFSLALALPFSVFSMFPSWMKSLPRSGSWLNTVKVVLGFLELALALKFLSNVDLAYHWEWLDREIFLALWIVIFGLLGVYLLGKLRLTEETEQERISPMRLILAVIVLAFTLYMVPGMWGAPLKAISAFLPPQHTQDFDLYQVRQAGGALPVADEKKRKYSDIFHAPYNLDAFFDYDEGLAYARKVDKPVLVDFTGHACVNCRKMEGTVWSEPGVLERLREDYVLIQLYVDDKTELKGSEYYKSALNGKMITTIGGKNSDLQASLFKSNSQPYYVLLDTDGKVLIPPRGADYDAGKFEDFLDQGKKLFRAG